MVKVGCHYSHGKPAVVNNAKRTPSAISARLPRSQTVTRPHLVPEVQILLCPDRLQVFPERMLPHGALEELLKSSNVQELVNRLGRAPCTAVGVHRLRIHLGKLAARDGRRTGAKHVHGHICMRLSGDHGEKGGGSPSPT